VACDKLPLRWSAAITIAGPGSANKEGHMSEDSTRNIILTTLEALTEKLDNFEAKIDARLTALEAQSYDTHPIWEQALAEIAGTRAEMRERFDRIEERLDLIEHKLAAINDDILTLRAEDRRLDKRVTKLEGERA
jgi:uncharacterized coiled-coil protein SlyX